MSWGLIAFILLLVALFASLLWPRARAWGGYATPIVLFLATLFVGFKVFGVL